MIIGRLIPAGTGLAQYRALEVTGADGNALGILEVMPEPDLLSEPLEKIEKPITSVASAMEQLGGNLTEVE